MKRYLTALMAAALVSILTAYAVADERVRFPAGTSGTELSDSLAPGESIRYVLGARNGQFFNVRVAAHGPDIYYQIFNPDGTFLLDQMTSNREYRGQLWQSGDHVVEVINRGNGVTSYNVIFSIDAAPAAEKGLSELVGMRGRNLDYQMSERGYSNVGGYKSEGASFTTWWNSGKRDCVVVEMRDGRVAGIESVVAGNCQ